MCRKTQNRSRNIVTTCLGNGVEEGFTANMKSAQIITIDLNSTVENKKTNEKTASFQQVSIELNMGLAACVYSDLCNIVFVNLESK